MLSASAADMNKSSASSEVRLKPAEDKGFGFLAREDLVGGCAGGGRKAELEEPSSREESVMVLSLLDSSEFDSVSEALAVFSLSMSSQSREEGREGLCCCIFLFTSAAED